MVQSFNGVSFGVIVFQIYALIPCNGVMGCYRIYDWLVDGGLNNNIVACFRSSLWVWFFNLWHAWSSVGFREPLVLLYVVSFSHFHTTVLSFLSKGKKKNITKQLFFCCWLVFEMLIELVCGMVCVLWGKGTPFCQTGLSGIFYPNQSW